MTIRWLLNNIINGYIYSTLIVLIISSAGIFSKLKTEKYLNKANLSILIILFIHLIYAFIRTPFLVAEYNTYTAGDTSDKIWITNFYNYTHLLITIAFGFLFHLIFIYQKNRINFRYTIFSVVLLFILVHLGNIIVLGVRYKDNFSSAVPQYFFNTTNLSYIAIFSLLFFIIHWLIKKDE